MTNPNKLGGIIPVPSVARDNKFFVPDGRYWQGGVWLPTSYMTVKSLEKYGKFDLASSIADVTINHMVKTYEQFFPQTIWECYSPTSYEPAKAKTAAKYCRPDFCGWSALGPISMLIENTLGFHRADAVAGKLEYHYRPEIGRHGIRNFKFGDITCDIIIENGKINYKTNNPFTFSIDGKDFLFEGAGSITI